MRTTIHKRMLALFTAVFIYLLTASAGAPGKPATTQASTLDGHWKGVEKCKNIPAPAASILIEAKSATELVITGIYSTTGSVKAQLRGKTIVIPLQKITDPMFMNIYIEGNLTVNKQQTELSGIVLIKNNDARDDCGVTYHR